MEPSASGRAGKAPAYPECVGWGGGTYRRGYRLYEGSAGPTGAVADGPPGDAGHRWLRPHRQSRGLAAAFQSEPRVARRGRGVAPGAARPVPPPDIPPPSPTAGPDPRAD